MTQTLYFPRQTAIAITGHLHNTKAFSNPPKIGIIESKHNQLAALPGQQQSHGSHSHCLATKTVVMTGSDVKVDDQSMTICPCWREKIRERERPKF